MQVISGWISPTDSRMIMMKSTASRLPFMTNRPPSGRIVSEVQGISTIARENGMLHFLIHST